MDRNTMETISASYTVYTLLNPEDKITISIDTFAECYRTNLEMLSRSEEPVVTRQAPPANSKGTEFNENQASDMLEKGMGKAEETLNDKDKMERFLEKLKARMKTLPMVGNVLSNVPTMFKLINSYFKGEYEDIPRKELLITISALSYLVAPIDIIPDFIPVAGLIDDMAVVSLCIKLTKGELEKYLAWREQVKTEKEEE